MDTVLPYILVAILVPIVGFFGILLIFSHIKKYRKITHNVNNTDAFTRKFIFNVQLTKEEFLIKLKIPNVNDKLEYELNDECTIITFKKDFSKISYNLEVIEIDKELQICVEQIPIFYGKTNIPFLINEFFISKFNAMPVKYFE